MKALGEVEVDDDDVSTATFALPSPSAAASTVQSMTGPLSADWNSDADSQHRALLKALGEVEVDEDDDVSTATFALPSPSAAASTVQSTTGSCYASSPMSADWNGDADSQHRALLKALGEVEVDDDDDVSTATFALPSSSAAASTVQSTTGSYYASSPMSADWNGDADSQHRALLKALGEVEVDDVDVSTATFALPSPSAAASTVQSMTGPLSADWNSDADSQHRALLKALGEVEVDEDDDVSTATFALPSPSAAASTVQSTTGSYYASSPMGADWNGDADSQHRALLKALGEVEVDEDDDVSTATFALPSPSAAASTLQSTTGSYHASSPMSADWNGDADSQHRALLKALGEVEVDEDDDVSTATFALPSPSAAASTVQSTTGSYYASSPMSADWNGDADSQHRALLKALGEVEVDEDDDVSTATFALPSPSAAASTVQSTTGSYYASSPMSADWNGDADSQHRALLKALGEVEVDEDDDVSTATFALPSPSAAASTVQSTTGSYYASSPMSADWNGDADSQHRALLKALGEVEVD